MTSKFDPALSIINRAAIKDLFNLESYQMHLVQNPDNLDLEKQSMHQRVKDNEFVVHVCTFDGSKGYVPLRSIKQPGSKTVEIQADFNLIFMTDKHIGPPVFGSFTREQMIKLVDEGKIRAEENTLN